MALIRRVDLSKHGVGVLVLYRLRWALLLLAALAIVATIGYVTIEHYSWIDAVYMTVITLGTIG